MVLPLKSADGKLVLLVSNCHRRARVSIITGSDFVPVQGGGVHMVLGVRVEGIGNGYSDRCRKKIWREDR